MICKIIFSVIRFMMGLNIFIALVVSANWMMKNFIYDPMRWLMHCEGEFWGYSNCDYLEGD